MARLIIPQRLELVVVTTQSTISRECLCQRPVRKVLQRRASRTAVIRHRQLSSTDCTIARNTDACTRARRPGAPPYVYFEDEPGRPSHVPGRSIKLTSGGGLPCVQSFYCAPRYPTEWLC